MRICFFNFTNISINGIIGIDRCRAVIIQQRLTIAQESILKYLNITKVFNSGIYYSQITTPRNSK